jgi:hypothetical protein
MFVLIVWVMEITIKPMVACRTPGLAFILPIVGTRPTRFP